MEPASAAVREGAQRLRGLRHGGVAPWRRGVAGAVVVVHVKQDDVVLEVASRRLLLHIGADDVNGLVWDPTGEEVDSFHV